MHDFSFGARFDAGHALRISAGDESLGDPSPNSGLQRRLKIFLSIKRNSISADAGIRDADARDLETCAHIVDDARHRGAAINAAAPITVRRWVVKRRMPSGRAIEVAKARAKAAVNSRGKPLSRARRRRLKMAPAAGRRRQCGAEGEQSATWRAAFPSAFLPLQGDARLSVSPSPLKEKR